MLSVEKSMVVWAWVCPITGMVLDECWAGTKPYAVTKSTRVFGKRRIECGEFRAVRVTIEPLSDAEQESHEHEYAVWLAKKIADEKARDERKGAA